MGKLIAAGGAYFLESTWTAHEREYSVGRSDRLATRWAAKEAVIKALGRGIGSIDPIDIEVRSIEGVAPSLILRKSAKSAASLLGICDWSLSMSHQGDLAIATASALGETND
ncbi:MAG: 4'-phosphopantetheinyl transferase superfamily protein [Microcella sp.]|nr:MAG: 4'-phosphopantetheinyl transferase superfamily protein [Microcella sp.]